MMRFIYVCMAFLLISFIGIPVYKGVSSEHEKLTTVAQADTDQGDGSLSFREIYALADESASENPAFLNDIMPAAGENAAPDKFSGGFVVREDSALADTPKETIDEAIVEETNL